MAKLKKCVDILKINKISFTGKPKTGEEYLFWKSNDGGVMMHSLDEMIAEEMGKMGAYDMMTRMAVKKAIDIIEPIKDKLPTFLVDALNDIANGEAMKKSADILLKDASPELIALFKSQQAIIAEQESNLEKAMKEEVERIRKANEEFAKTVPFIPFKKDEMADMLAQIEQSMGKDFVDKLRDMIYKAHDAIRSSGASKETQNGSGAEAGTVDPAVQFMHEVKKSFDLVSGPNEDARFRRAIGLVMKSRSDLYDAYNLARKKGLVKDLTLESMREVG